MDRKGVEPLNGVAELIYSQRPLATWIPVQLSIKHYECAIPHRLALHGLCDQGQSRRRELNSRPSAYKADALPLSYVGAKQASRAKTSSPLADIIPHNEQLGQAIDRMWGASGSIPAIDGLVKNTIDFSRPTGRGAAINRLAPARIQ